MKPSRRPPVSCPAVRAPPLCSLWTAILSVPFCCARCSDFEMMEPWYLKALFVLRASYFSLRDAFEPLIFVLPLAYWLVFRCWRGYVSYSVPIVDKAATLIPWFYLGAFLKRYNFLDRGEPSRQTSSGCLTAACCPAYARLLLPA